MCEQRDCRGIGARSKRVIQNRDKQPWYAIYYAPEIFPTIVTGIYGNQTDKDDITFLTFTTEPYHFCADLPMGGFRFLGISGDAGHCDPQFRSNKSADVIGT